MPEYIERRKEIISQYKAMKRNHPDAILLFQNGDFYEAIYDDAKDVSEIVGLTLVQSEMLGKSKKVPLVGFPHHALNKYLRMIVRKGRRVATCEQLKDPSHE